MPEHLVELEKGRLGLLSAGFHLVEGLNQVGHQVDARHSREGMIQEPRHGEDRLAREQSILSVEFHVSLARHLSDDGLDRPRVVQAHFGKPLPKLGTTHRSGLGGVLRLSGEFRQQNNAGRRHESHGEPVNPLACSGDALEVAYKGAVEDLQHGVGPGIRGGLRLVHGV